MRALRATCLATLPVVITTSIAALSVETAHAAGVMRYASPSGTSAQTCLTPAAACNLEKAVNTAAANDVVILAAGSYTTATALQNSNTGLTVRGASTSSRPVITTSATNGLVLTGTNVTVRDIEIDHTGSNIALSASNVGALVERVVMRSDGLAACSTAHQGLLRDSLCVATGTGGVGVYMGFSTAGSLSITGHLRNVTAVATGEFSYGMRIDMSGASLSQQLDLRNVIAQGATDISRTASSGASSTITATTSNYLTVTSSGSGGVTPAGTAGNQSAQPVFADGVLFHQAPSSPTVDAGGADGFTGASDLDGTPRPSGAAADIGADERPEADPPETTIVKKPRKRTFSRRMRVTFTSDESGSTFTCKLDRKRVKPCASPFKKRRLRVGRHTIKVWATDAAGNTDPTPAKYSWRVRATSS